MRFISLFAGIGGFDLGLESAGHKCIGQVEIDKHAREILIKHWPDVPKHDDVKTAIEWGQVNDFKGSVDIVAGGFPCQDLSVAGKRAGLEGSRSGLFYNALALAESVAARFILLENVPGLLTSNGGRDFGRLITVLAQRGYSNIQWRILDSQYFGVAQRRRRVFIIASSHPGSGYPILFEPESLRGNTTTGKESGETITGKITDRTRGGGVVDTLTVSDLIKSQTSNQAVDSNLLQVETAYRIREVARQNRFDATEIDKAGTLQAIRPSVQSHHSQTFIVTNKVRRLTPLECERLQGFPDNWTAGQSDTQRYKQLGNAVTVPVIEWIGRRLNG